MNDKTTIAVLGTLAEFHKEPIPFDLAALVDLVVGIHPDLLCLDMTREQWQEPEKADLPPEYREALLPLAYQTDMVIVPVAGADPDIRLSAAGWRGRLIAFLRRRLAWLQRTAPGPDAINQGWRHDLGNLFYGWIRRLAGGTAGHHYHDRIDLLADSVAAVARDNPGSRILVVTNIQYCHHVRPRLAGLPDVEVTGYADL